MNRGTSGLVLHQIFWSGILLLILLMPLVFSTSCYRSFETTKSSLLRIGVTLLLLIWSLFLYRKKNNCFSFSPITRALLFFLFIFFLSSLFSIEPTLSIFGTYDRQVGLIGILAVSFFYVLLIEGVRMGGKERSVIHVMVLSGFLASFYSLLQYLNVDPIEWSKAFGNRPSSTVGHPDFLGGLLAMTIPLAISLFYLEEGLLRKGIWLFFFLVQLGGILVSQTRGAWIAATASITTFFFLEPFLYRKNAKLFRKKIVVSLIALFLLTAFGVSFLLLNPQFRNRAASIFKSREQARLYLWRDSFNVIKEYPLLGSGPETFRLAFMPHKSLALATMEKNVNFDNPHNNYLYLWTTTGTVGIIAYLYLLFCSFKEGIKKIKEDSASFPPTLCLGILTSLEAYCITMLTGFDTLSTIFYFYGIIALLATKSIPKSGQTEPLLSLTKRQNGFKVAMILVSFILFLLTLFDSSRVVLADSRALKAMKEINKPSPDSFKAKNFMLGACNLLPRESFYCLQLGMVHLTLWQKEKTREAYLREAIQWGYLSLFHGWAPENSYNLISTAYLFMGNCLGAEKVSKRALEIDPHNFPLRTNLAIALSCQGKHQEARSEVEKALAIAPEYPIAKKLREWLLKGLLLP